MYLFLSWRLQTLAWLAHVLCQLAQISQNRYWSISCSVLWLLSFSLDGFCFGWFRMSMFAFDVLSLSQRLKISAASSMFSLSERAQYMNLLAYILRACISKLPTRLQYCPFLLAPPSLPNESLRRISVLNTSKYWTIHIMSVSVSAVSKHPRDGGCSLFLNDLIYQHARLSLARQYLKKDQRCGHGVLFFGFLLSL